MSTAQRTSHLADADLMRLVVERQPADADAALAELHRRHARSLRDAVRRRYGDQGAIDDVVQECFLRAWRHAHRFDPACGSVGGWLRTIAMRTAVDLFRCGRRSVVPTASLDEPGSRRAEPSCIAGHDHDTEMRMVLDGALATLSAEHRVVLDHAYRGDLTQQQIAVRLGLPLGTVKTRTFHALASMRRSVLPALAA